jgi:hypothetical protein
MMRPDVSRETEMEEDMVPVTEMVMSLRIGSGEALGAEEGSGIWDWPFKRRFRCAW